MDKRCSGRGLTYNSDMSNITFCFINDKEEKKRTVASFAYCFYNQSRGEQELAQLAEKIAAYAELLAVNVGSETAGYTAYYRNDKTSGTAYITAIVLGKAYRGIGLGTQMLKRVIEDCRLNGFTSLRLEVDNANLAAVNLYTKLGFRKEKEASGSSSYYCLTL